MIQVQCHERDGTVLRTATMVKANLAKLDKIYLKVKDLPNFITAEPGAIKYRDLFSLLEPNVALLEVDDVGVIVVRYHPKEECADVHITFWDRRLRGRESLCRAVADYLMDFLKVRGLFTAIPGDSRATLAFARRVGFRDAAYHNGVVTLTYTNYTVQKDTEDTPDGT